MLVDIVIDLSEAKSRAADFLEDSPVCGHMLDDYGGVSGGVIWGELGVLELGMANL